MSKKKKDKRPSYCWGECPKLASGGYDCTCRSNQECEKFVPDRFVVCLTNLGGVDPDETMTIEAIFKSCFTTYDDALRFSNDRANKYGLRTMRDLRMAYIKAYRAAYVTHFEREWAAIGEVADRIFDSGYRIPFLNDDVSVAEFEFPDARTWFLENGHKQCIGVFVLDAWDGTFEEWDDEHA